MCPINFLGQKSEESEKAASEKVKIDFDGINGRIEALPVSSGNYTILGSVEGGLLYSSEGTIMRYNLEEQKTELMQTNNVKNENHSDLFHLYLFRLGLLHLE